MQSMDCEAGYYVTCRQQGFKAPVLATFYRIQGAGFSYTFFQSFITFVLQFLHLFGNLIIEAFVSKSYYKSFGIY